jgi:hypothetical protein
MLGYWRRQPRYGYRGARAYDPLEDKLMCDACRRDHPLGPYYFADYHSYVTDDAIKRVQAEADSDSPADAAQALYQSVYRSQLRPAFDSSSSEEQQVASHTAALPVDEHGSSMQVPAVFQNRPLFIAGSAVQRTLASVLDAVGTHFAGAESAVLPILDYVVARAEDIAQHRAHNRWEGKRTRIWADSSDWQYNRQQDAIQRFAPGPTRFMIDSWNNRSLRLDADPFEYP